MGKCKDLLTDALELTATDREATYGDKQDNHANIAAIWSVILGHKIEPYQVALCMAGLKIARASRPDGAQHRDNYVDLAGYAGVAWECVAPQPITTYKDTKPKVHPSEVTPKYLPKTKI